MKHIVFSLISIFFFSIANAQNSDPWPVTGNVGIGTANPQATLHLKNTTPGARLITFEEAIYSSGIVQNGYNLTVESSANFHINYGSFSNRNTFRLESAPNAARFWISNAYGAFVNGYKGFKIGTDERFGFQTLGSNAAYSAIGTVFTNNDNSGLTFFTKNAGLEYEAMRLASTGFVGIGTTAPSAVLHVNGTVRLQGLTSDDTREVVLVADANGNVFTRAASTLGGSSSNAWALDGSTVGALKKFGTTDNYDLPLITNNIEAMRITAGGNIGIGTATPQTKLAVNGDITAKKVRVTATGWPAWPDYVFYEGYKLPCLTEVEAFIKKNKHLPEVPSAKEVEADGLDLGNNQAVLLKKIEELTLYAIDQQKQIEELKKEVAELKKSMNP